MRYNHDVPFPTLRERDVLVGFHHASLNHRDLIIAKVKSYSISSFILPSYLASLPENPTNSVDD